MSAQETALLAEELRLSGDVIDLDRLTQPKIAKVSTGGVGDKTSMVLGPLGAAAGVIMPGMNGVELAGIIRDRFPGLPVVLTSGYSNVLAENAHSGFELIQKPYSVEALSRTLRKAIAEQRAIATKP